MNYFNQELHSYIKSRKFRTLKKYTKLSLLKDYGHKIRVSLSNKISRVMKTKYSVDKTLNFSLSIFLDKVLKKKITYINILNGLKYSKYF